MFLTILPNVKCIPAHQGLNRSTRFVSCRGIAFSDPSLIDSL